MYDRIEDRVNALEARIAKFADALKDRHGFQPTGQAFYASQDKVLAVGCIGCESEGGRLNSTSVILEGSGETSGGARVKLDLGKLPKYSVFPGQIVGVEGMNPTGHCLVASRLLDSVPLPLFGPKSSAEVAQTFKRPKMEPGEQYGREAASGAPPAPAQVGDICILAAGGPFTTAEDFEYEPFKRLLTYAARRQPHLLILMGPFVDAEHPQIKNGTVDATFDHIFQEHIRDPVEKWCAEAGEHVQVALVPALRDAQHDAVFPQPPFRREDFEDAGRQIITLGNPGAFSCGPLGVACTTLDVLRHLSSEEARGGAARGAPQDRLAILAGHLVGQRSFLPLYPPPQGTPVNYALCPDALELPFTPHLLLLPSDLAPFVKALPPVPPPSVGEELPGRQPDAPGEMPMDGGDGEPHTDAVGVDVARPPAPEAGPGADCRPFCVNPGRLVKGLSGGTFAEIQVSGVTREAGSSWCNDISKYVSVQILKVEDVLRG